MQTNALISTAALAPPERFGFWIELLTQTAMPIEVRTAHEADFDATIHQVAVGPVELMSLRHPPLNVRRPPRLIRRSDPDVYHVVLSQAGDQWLTQDGREVIIRPGDMTVYHSSHPLQTRTDVTLERESAVVVVIPTAVLPLPARRVRDVIATKLSGADALTAIVSCHLQALLANAGRLDPADSVRLSTVTLDLISHMIARRLDAEAALPPESRERALFARILSFMESQLHDPDLNPATVAAAHHVSPRTLHRLFQAQGLSVAGWIRARRLEHCRRDLADRALAARPIAAIAGRWGMREHSLARAFKTAYGVSPSTYRDRHTHD
ncbi:helix-turn-helix domain-containing protein [Luedemannella flava]|uniref:AraC-like ligand-binding domain-containing protein n=1 Tax=Luedemannella flava TaxID=349316 RepID=UPI0031D8B95A